MEKLQKELQTRQNEMEKMREKERNWEEQVKQLKVELKNARQKERDLAKLVLEKPQQRAETAPMTGSGHLLPLVGKPSAAEIRSGAKPTAVVPNRLQGENGKKRAFNEARIFSEDTFRPITAPLEPIDSRTSSSHLPPLPESLKMASFNTQKTAFGLRTQHGVPVALDYATLCSFIPSSVITRVQADALWGFFLECSESTVPSPAGMERVETRGVVTVSHLDSPTYETYAELDDDEYGEDFEG
jgi:hypothetical protein